MSGLDEANRPEEIAIVGMAGRFPGGNNIDQFWSNLRDSVESISVFTDQDLQRSGISEALFKDPNYVRCAGVLEDIDQFDASFFNISPREADIMDPQQRLFLETAWEAIEDAGLDPDRFPGTVGVYAGIGMVHYLHNILANPELMSTVDHLSILIGNEKDHLPLRTSYKLNLRGPSINVNTACSTSLVAVHLACQALLLGECDAALAGGVTIAIPQKAGYLFQEEGLFSPDGHCRAFDQEANGTVGGSGAGIVVLRRLSDALADGDNIQAVIKASAVNNDGSLKVSYTAPGPKGQAGVIAEAIALARVRPETIGYIETHGSGTPLGDAIEFSALTGVFRSQTAKAGFCALGSVKTNIGHLDAAAGVAGLIKTVLSLRHKLIPASLNYRRKNPRIDIEGSPFYINTEPTEWKASDGPRRAGVSSFGIGGTNAHVIVEEAPNREATVASQPWFLIPLSTRSEASLDTATERLLQHLNTCPGQSLADIAYTYQMGRKQFEYRRVLLARDRAALIDVIENQNPRYFLSGHVFGARRPVTFMFPGLGDHYPNMTAELYQNEAAFKSSMDYCAAIMKRYVDIDITSVIYHSERAGEKRPGTDDGAGHSAPEIDLRRMLQAKRASGGNGMAGLSSSVNSQLALFAVEYSLARLLMQWGIKPDSMIGYSIGEYVAACLAGVFSLEDAIHLVAKRGLIIESLDEGAMLAVAMPEMELRQLLSRDLSVAAVNTASLCVVSGPEEDTKAFEALLERKGILSRRVEAAHAFHSTMMDAGSGRLVAEARNIKLSAPAIPYISNVTGTWISDSQARDPGYWGRHMCETVRFDDGITQLLKTPERILLEVGPGRSLGSHAVQHPAIKGESQVVVLSTLPHSYERVSEEASVLKAVGRLWLAGIEPNWAGFHGEERRHKVTLPSYPFERTTHWVDARPAAPIADERPADIGWISDIADWFSVPSWKRKLSRRDHGNEARRRGRHLLVFAGDGPLCTLLMRRLEEDGQNVMVVRSADRFSRLSDNLYQIDPSKPKDYERLIGDLIRTNRSPAQIIHLWSVTGTVQASDQEVFDRVQTLGFYSLLFLAQALAKHELATGMVDRSKECLRVEVVSDEMQSVIGDEDINPEKATLLGPCKTIPQEYPSVICRSIDIAVPAPESSRLEKVVERLFDEITGPPDDLVVAYRGNNRWVEYYEPIRIEKSSREPALLRERGVYLFTGGLGRDGLVRAKYLAQNFRARLILTGRTGLPPKDEWLSYLAAHGGDDRTSDRIRKVLEIEELGSEVEVVKADVGSEVDMRRVMKLADERFGRLDGVIHSAGVAEFAGSVEFSKTVAELSRGDCERHFQPKVHGCYVIEKVLQGRALDFCILTSSIASITSGIGVLAYTAASIFLDAFAHKHNQKGPVWWMSVNWQGVSPEDTVEGFRRMLSIGAPIPQLVVSPEDLEASINRRIKLDFLRAAMPAGVTLHSRPKLGTPFVAPRNGAEQGVVDLWRQLLGIDEIGVNDNFLELGADSLLAVQFVSRVRTAFNVTASLRDVFEAPTAADFALVIEELVIREIDALTEEEAKTLTREERVHGPAALSPSEAKT